MTFPLHSFDGPPAKQDWKSINVRDAVTVEDPILGSYTATIDDKSSASDVVWIRNRYERRAFDYREGVIIRPVPGERDD